jgi:hypothetical protein
MVQLGNKPELRTLKLSPNYLMNVHYDLRNWTSRAIKLCQHIDSAVRSSTIANAILFPALFLQADFGKIAIFKTMPGATLKVRGRCRIDNVILTLFTTFLAIELYWTLRICTAKTNQRKFKVQKPSRWYILPAAPPVNHLAVKLGFFCQTHVFVIVISVYLSHPRRNNVRAPICQSDCLSIPNWFCPIVSFSCAVWRHSIFVPGPPPTARLHTCPCCNKSDARAVQGLVLICVRPESGAPGTAFTNLS